MVSKPIVNVEADIVISHIIINGNMQSECPASHGEPQEGQGSILSFILF